MKRNIKVILLTSLVTLSMFVVSGCDLFIKTNKGSVDLKWYMGLTYEDDSKNDVAYKTSVGDQVAAVALEDKYSDEYGIIKDTSAYVNIDTVKSNIDKRFYWDKKDKKLFFTNATEVYYVDESQPTVIHGNTDETVNYKVFLKEKKKCYVNLQFIQKFVDLDSKITKKSGKAPAIISLKYTSGEKTTFKTDSETEMRTKGDYQNLIVKTLSKGTTVTLLGSGKNWDKVRTDDGYIGYVPVKELTDESKKKVSYKNDDSEYTHIAMDGKVSLAWNQIYNQTANKNLESLLSKTKDINVVSPTWFSLVDRNGNLSTLADLDYVEKAHKKNIQVWALFNDFTDRNLTKKVLTSTKLRQRKRALAIEHKAAIRKILMENQVKTWESHYESIDYNDGMKKAISDRYDNRLEQLEKKFEREKEAIEDSDSSKDVKKVKIKVLKNRYKAEKERLKQKRNAAKHSKG